MSDRHIVQQPKFIFFIKIAQIVLGFLLLALTAFALSEIKNVDGTFGFNIFCCIYTFVACGYLVGTPIWSPALWNCWAALALEAVGCVFWLCAFATMASFASLGSVLTSYYKRDAYAADYSGYSTDYTSSSDTSANAYYESYAADQASAMKKYLAAWKCTAAVAGLGGLMWVFFVISLVVYSISLHRHRTNPENADLPADGTPTVEEVKSGHEMEPVQQY